MTTLLARRAQLHQERLVAGLDAGNPALHARLSALAATLARAGTSSADAARKAYGSWPASWRSRRRRWPTWTCCTCSPGSRP